MPAVWTTSTARRGQRRAVVGERERRRDHRDLHAPLGREHRKRGEPLRAGVFMVAGWVRYVRIIRAQTLVLREMQFIEASRAIGATSLRIIGKHIVPNLVTEIVILMNLEVGRIILIKSSLSYLGLGVQPPLPTWGNMLNEGRLYLQTSWWVVTFPGLAIMASVLGINLLSEGLRSLYVRRATAGPIVKRRPARVGRRLPHRFFGCRTAAGGIL